MLVDSGCLSRAEHYDYDHLDNDYHRGTYYHHYYHQYDRRAHNDDDNN